MIELLRVKYDKNTETEIFTRLTLEKEEIACVYKGNQDVYITTTQGYSYKVPYKMDLLVEKLGI